MKRGKKCVIIDADFGLANVEVLMGIIPQFNFSDVVSGSKGISDILTEGPNGLKFISGGSGFTQLAGMTDEKITYLVESLGELDSITDIILIDTGAGISQRVIDFVTVSGEAVIITTPEPTSITDAYAIIKSIKEKKGPIPKFNIVVNRVESKKEGDEIFQKLERVCERFLEIKLHSLGSLPYDQNLVKAVKAQKPVGILYPNSPVVRSIDRVSDLLLNNSNAYASVAIVDSGVKSFMKRLINVFKQ
jgi:flagellar biosynthesis protein FlhG